VKAGKPDAHVTIDADTRIPWSEVIAVVNAIKRAGIEKIEFAMGAPKRDAK
jgi:biopolymer transport protein ExbD